MARPCKELWHRWHHQTAERQRYHIEEATRTVRSRGDANTPAHQILKQAVDVKSRRLTDRHQTVLESCKIVGIAGRCYGLPLPMRRMRYDDDDDDMMIMVIFSLCLSSLNPARESGWAVKSTGFLHTLKVIWGNNGSFCSSVPGSPFMSPRTEFLLLKS